MYRLDRPSMAVNDPRVAGAGSIRRFQMWNTWDIAAAETREHIVEWVAEVARGADGGKLKNLVLSCHGNAGRLHLGQGFDGSHMGLFENWRGLIEKIWLPDCLVARIPDDPAQHGGINDGNVFCSNLAKKVQCYVVAPTETQCEYPVTIPIDMMTSFEGLVLCYGPAGNITWQSRNASTYTNGAGQCVPVPD